MPEAVIRLPFPPSVNGLFAGKARRYTSKQYARWKRAAGLEILAQRVRPIQGQIEIAVYLTPPDRRPRDASNYVKGIEDLLVAMGIIVDDRAACVRKSSAEWTDGAEPGAVVVIRGVVP